MAMVQHSNGDSNALAENAQDVQAVQRPFHMAERNRNWTGTGNQTQYLRQRITPEQRKRKETKRKAQMLRIRWRRGGCTEPGRLYQAWGG